MKLRDQLHQQILLTNQFDEIELDSSDDSDDSWLLLKKRLEDSQIEIEVSFDRKGNNLKEIKVWSHPLIIDEDTFNTIL